MRTSSSSGSVLIKQFTAGDIPDVADIFTQSWESRHQNFRPALDFYVSWFESAFPDTSIPVRVEVWGVAVEKNLLAELWWESEEGGRGLRQCCLGFVSKITVKVRMRDLRLVGAISRCS